MVFLRTSDTTRVGKNEFVNTIYKMQEGDYNVVVGRTIWGLNSLTITHTDGFKIVLMEPANRADIYGREYIWFEIGSTCECFITKSKGMIEFRKLLHRETISTHTLPRSNFDVALAAALDELYPAAQ